MHRPFEVLADWIAEHRTMAPEKPHRTPVDDDVSDDVRFARAIEGVRRVDWNSAPPPEPGSRALSAEHVNVVVAALEEVCRSGDIGPMETREYVEGVNAPIGRLYLAALREGRFSIQAHLDLHGLTVASARVEVERFVREAHRAGHLSVRIVHGRGRHSAGRVPRMKPSVERWLGERRLARYVLAYATAHPVDGGAGAIYVLLRPGVSAVGQSDRGPRRDI